MQTVTVKIEFMSATWEVTGDYYPGTNHPINSALLEPNDDPEFEIKLLEGVTINASAEFFEGLWSRMIAR